MLEFLKNTKKHKKNKKIKFDRVLFCPKAEKVHLLSIFGKHVDGYSMYIYIYIWRQEEAELM